MKLPEYIEYALKCLTKSNHAAHLVGGCVRDILMGREPNDYDIATSALPEQTEAVFSAHKLILTGIKHGTVAVVIANNTVEITTYRIDGEYEDKRHPKSVSFTDDLCLDLARRDFTVNAMAMSIDGKVCDPFGGREDIASGIIRCVGKPEERFAEDALRILRALRFSAVLGFNIEHNTANAIHKMRELLKSISSERIQSELFKLIMGNYAGAVLSEYLDVMRVLLGDIRTDCIGRIGECEGDLAFRLGALFTDDKSASKSLRSLKVSNGLHDEVMFLVRNQSLLLFASITEIKRLIGEYGRAAVMKLIAFSEFVHNRRLDNVRDIADGIVKRGDACSIRDLCITGNDLREIGLNGVEVGKCLKFLLDEVMADKLKNNMRELKKAALRFKSNINNNM